MERTGSALLVCMIACAMLANGETGYAAWLRYQPANEAVLRSAYAELPATVVKLDDSFTLTAAQKELIRGVQGLLGRTLRASNKPVQEDMIVLGTLESVKHAFPAIPLPIGLMTDGYWMKTTGSQGRRILLITSPNDRGVLYGT
ncbi:MAG: hypothetical protein JO033_09295, partial [Acidobacteriaceae bacterium]|nr:hypothetical protein [Acidobacteriaceae bacterium]